MAFNDCVHMREEKNDFGQNICPYSPATSFACPYGSVESASAYCPKYTPQEKIDNGCIHKDKYDCCPVPSITPYCTYSTSKEAYDNCAYYKNADDSYPGGRGGAGGKTEVVIHYDESDGLERENALYHLKQANYHFAKAIELLEKEKNNE